ncbi:MAG: hypothetical protein ACKO8X_01925 [Verrucomicrobiota bacterium]
MHRRGMLFGLIWFASACLGVGCAPSRRAEGPRAVTRVFVVPPPPDTLAEAAHDAFVRALRQRGYVVPASSPEADAVARLSWRQSEDAQALCLSLSDPAGGLLRSVTGEGKRRSFWTSALAADAAGRLAARLGQAPMSKAGGD